MNKEQLQKIKIRLDNLPMAERELIIEQLKQQLDVNPEPEKEALMFHELTSAQQRLWVLGKFERVKSLYHVPMVLELPSSINYERLYSAINVLSQEHPQLTSYFVENESGLMQYYSLDQPPVIENIELDKDLGDVLTIQTDQPLADFFLKPFQLDKAPLIRFAFVHAPTCHYLMICCHHLIMDAWSAGLLIKHLTTIYLRRSITEIMPSKLIEYKKYGLWERAQAQSSVYAEALQYWEMQLKNRNWEIDLAIDFPRPRYLSGRGSNVLGSITSIDYQKLQQLARQKSVTVNHVILSIFQFIIGRYSGQDDITIGIPVAGRQHNAWQNTIGLFVNTCLHAIKLDYSASFTQHLFKMKDQLLRDLAYSIIPYDQLLKHFYTNQLCQQGSTFNVLYNFLQTEHVDEIEFLGQACKTKLCLLPVSKFDLSLTALMGANEITLLYEYSTDLFRVSTIEQINQDLLRYLDAFISQPDDPLQAIIWALNNY